MCHLASLRDCLKHFHLLSKKFSFLSVGCVVGWRGIYLLHPDPISLFEPATQQRSGWRKLVDRFYSNDRKWLVEWFWERCMGISGKNLSGTLTSFISLDRVHKRSDRWRTPTAPKIKQQKLREAKVRESKNPTASNPSTLTSLINVDCVDKRSASQHQLRILTSWISSLFQRHSCLNH